MAGTGDGAAQRLVRRADAFQRRHGSLAFAVGVAKKYGDDRAGQLAALIAYYGFFSLFPLVLVFAAIAAFVLRGDPPLRQRVVASALDLFPVVGPEIGREIRHGVRALSGSPVALIVGVVGSLWTGTAVVAAAQQAMNDVWDVPRVERPGILSRLARAFLLLFVFGASIVLSTFLAGSGQETGASAVVLPAISTVGLVLASIAVFAFAYRILTVAPVSWRDVLPGAIAAGIGWSVLLMIGGWVVDRQISRASLAYGVFATVIGLLAWIYLAAQLFLVAGEVNVVRARRLWPRSLVDPPLTAQDQEVLAEQAEEQRARPQEDVEVRFRRPADRGR
jgi:YihY family inner membrane protein